MSIFKKKLFTIHNLRTGGPFLLTVFNTSVAADAGIVPPEGPVLTIFKHIQELPYRTNAL
jgi:hypothetical protein